MKRISLIIVLACRMLLAAEPSPSELFERARMLEEKNQNLPEAIRLYAMVVIQAKAQRALAGRAQYQQGVLLERLGRKAEAQRAYRAVLRDFADQPTVVKMARARIPGGGPETGMAVRQVWNPKENVYFGSPSPDGRWFSFGDWDTSELAIRELATGEKRRLAKNKQQKESNGFVARSLFSPDGSQVAYAWWEDAYEVRLVGVDGSRLRTIYKAGEDFTLLHDWSPDGASILASTTNPEATQLLLLSPVDGKVQLSRKIDWTGRPMKFSPDGRFIIYEAGGESGSDLRLLSVDGSRDTLLIEHPGHNFPLGRAGSGNHFVFASDRTGTLDMWDQVVVDGKVEGPPRLIKQDVGRISPLGFTRTGAFYYEINTSMFDVYVAEIDIQSGKVISAPKPAARRFVGSNRAPSWSPDGRSLLYWSARPFGDQVLVIQDLPSGKEREVRPALREFIRPAWRPDGKSIVVWGTGPENRRGFYAVDPQSGKATLLVDAGRVEVLPNAAWSRDGKTCFAYSGEAIYRVDLESGEVERLFSVPEKRALNVALLSLSPDERQLVFQVRNFPRGEVSLRMMPVTGGDARVIFRQQYPQEFHCCRPLSWTPDGSHVVAAQGPLGIDKSEVWLVPINGGEPVKTGLTMPGLKPPQLHPDGRRITFHTGDPDSSEVWVMENFLAPTGAGRSGGAR